MKLIQKAFFKVRDLYEIAIPSLAFLMMFVVFIWGIFCRYVLNASATWANEIQIMGYLWTVLPAALWARRRNDHVCFSLLYDVVNPVWQRVIRILGNLFMTAMYVVLTSGTITYITNLRQKSMALGISLKYLYMPFLILVVGILIYSIYDLVVDCRAVILEATGKKEPLSLEKTDKAQGILMAAEKEYNEQFASFLGKDANAQEQQGNGGNS